MMTWLARCVLADVGRPPCYCVMAVTGASTCGALVCAGRNRQLVTGTPRIALALPLAQQLPPLAALAAMRGPMALALRSVYDYYLPLWSAQPAGWAAVAVRQLLPARAGTCTVPRPSSQISTSVRPPLHASKRRGALRWASPTANPNLCAAAANPNFCAAASLRAATYQPTRLSSTCQQLH
jgi:hypothetical protein